MALPYIPSRPGREEDSGKGIGTAASVVKNPDGTLTHYEDGQPAGSSIYDEYLQYLDDRYNSMMDGIRRQQEAAISRIESQYAQAIDGLEQQRPGIEQRYEDTAQEAYIQNMLAKRDLPQQLAAQGMTGGLSESSQLALEADYGNQTNAARRDYDNNITNLENQIGQVRAAQADAVAAAESSYDSMLRDARAEYLGNLAQYNLQKQLYADEQKKYQDELAWQQKQWDQSLAEYEYQKEQDRIANELAREQWEWQKQYNEQQADREWELQNRKTGRSSGGLSAYYSDYPSGGTGYSGGSTLSPIPDPEDEGKKSTTQKKTAGGGKGYLPSMSFR